MKLRNGIALALAVAAVGATSMTRAGSDIDATKDAAVARLAFANIVSETDGRYIHARGLAVDGDGSVANRTSAWLRNEEAWIEAWTKVLALADCKDDIPYSQFMAQLAQMLDAQAQALVALQDEAAAIPKLASDALAVLGAVEPIPTGADAQAYATIVASLTAREGELKSMLGSVPTLPQQKVARLADIDAVSRQGIVAHLKSALVNRAKYPLQQALADVNALLAAEKIIDPRLARIEATFTAMNGYSAGLAYFHMQDAIGPARKLCTDFTTSIAVLTQPAKYLADSRAMAARMCNGIDQLYAGMALDPSTKASDYVSAYLSGEKTKLPALCGPTSTRPACQKLSLVASLSDADLASMSDAQLKLVELGWSAALDRAIATTIQPAPTSAPAPKPKLPVQPDPLPSPRSPTE